MDGQTKWFLDIKPTPGEDSVKIVEPCEGAVSPF